MAVPVTDEDIPQSTQVDEDLLGCFPQHMACISKICDLDCETDHCDGIDNQDADAVSGHPIVGAQSLIIVGADVALRKEFHALPKECKKTPKVR